MSHNRWFKSIIVFQALCLAGIILVTTGCPDPPSGRLNAPPQGQSQEKPEISENFVYMYDNAILTDMNVSPVHFVPRSAELNSLGVRQLNRLVPILKVYGGTMFYDGVEDEPSLADSRMERIKSFLLAHGVEADQFEIEHGLAGSTGMPAKESIQAKETAASKMTGSYSLFGGGQMSQ